MKNETELGRLLRLRASELGVSLWRNNSGVAVNADGQPVRFGLGNESANLNKTMKSSDYIGLTSRGTFVALELKSATWSPKKFNEREMAQWNFHEHVRRNQGIAGFVRSVADMEQLFAGRI